MDAQIRGGELPIGRACQYRITGTHRLLPSAIRQSENNPLFTILSSDFRTENVIIDFLRLMAARGSGRAKSLAHRQALGACVVLTVVTRVRTPLGSLAS